MGSRVAPVFSTCLLRIACVAGLVVAIAGFSPAAHAQAITPPPERSYDIPPQSLDTALATFARTSRVSVVYETGRARRLTSTRLQGRHTPATALNALLAGTGLAARFTGSRSAIVYVVGTSSPTESRMTGVPSMALNLAEIRAPATIGRSNERIFVEYARQMQGEIRMMLAGDPAYRDTRFRARVAVEIDSAGRIGRAKIVRGSGDATRDARLPDALTGRQLSAPPPEGIRQPLRFDVSADRPSGTG